MSNTLKPIKKDSESQSELLNTQNYASEKSNLPSGKLIERKQIPGTPYWEIKTETERYLIMGKWRLSDNLIDSNETIEQYIEFNRMELILQMIHIVVTEIDKINKYSEETLTEENI